MVDLRVVSSEPFSEAKLVVDDGVSRPLSRAGSEPDEGNTAGSARIAVEQSGRYQIELTSDMGFAGEPVSYDISALEDQAPQVSFAQPAADLAVDIDARVVVQVEASDDYALRELRLVPVGPDDVAASQAEPKPIKVWTVKGTAEGRAEGTVTIGDAGASLAERRALEQIAPGRYEAPLTTARAGRWLAVVDEQGRRVWQGPMIQRAANEFDAIGPDWQAMEQLARLTGGRIVRSPDAKSLSGAVVAAGDVALWPILLGAALLLALAAWLRLRGQLAPGAVGDRNRR